MKYLNFLLLPILAFIAIVQVVSYGKAIYFNLIGHECFNCVRLLEWVNFLCGFISIVVAGVFTIKMKSIKYAFIYILILIFLNLGFILLDFTLFFSSTLIPSN